MSIARSRQFDKQYKKLPKGTQEQFKERLTLFLNDSMHPLLHVRSLTGAYRGVQSFNVNADIRALFSIEDTNTVYLRAIGSHSTLYS